MKILFLTLWRGDISLWKTFWLFGIAALIVFPQLAIPAGLVGGLLHLSEGVLIFFLSLLVLIYMAYGILLIIAVSKSANKYRGPRIWASLAKLTITALVIIISFVNVQSVFKEIMNVANQGPVRMP